MSDRECMGECGRVDSYWRDDVGCCIECSVLTPNLALEQLQEQLMKFAMHVLNSSKHRDIACTPESCAKCAAERILNVTYE